MARHCVGWVWIEGDGTGGGPFEIPVDEGHFYWDGTCLRCDGTGRIKTVVARILGGEDTACPTCRGRGQLPEEPRPRAWSGPPGTAGQGGGYR